jgi:hypothetical protein
MKETGDMTKAVGQIIREQMAKAGDYVETAADRAHKPTSASRTRWRSWAASSHHLKKPATACGLL